MWAETWIIHPEMSYKGQWTGEPLKAKPKGVLLPSPARCKTVATECFHSPFPPWEGVTALALSSLHPCVLEVLEGEAHSLCPKQLHHPELTGRTDIAQGLCLLQLLLKRPACLPSGKIKHMSTPPQGRNQWPDPGSSLPSVPIDPSPLRSLKFSYCTTSVTSLTHFLLDDGNSPQISSVALAVSFQSMLLETLKSPFQETNLNMKPATYNLPWASYSL